ncbi:3-oxoacyl-ACP synthase III family protein [Desulfotignum phosphitoxidans]|uniref:Beta-ketoacyl-[acyl-carrier-protein] synthase III n=1 Tax=Desulfotignum phosphitoxidans DSM 13687 TaxID=1286635 RepID=S0FWG8_9BACT|nr:beta-ketoacyl-ACP synthase III [Desulfotignum phosphitoxidans]EMS79413.1 3-oxoacyl-[acyl-carrier-protein] synthase III FabH [Desulfotignum phosphitoxidans DSM 13687]
MKKASIRGTGMYVPPHVVTNRDLEKMMDTSDEWIRQRTGIKQRYWINEDCGASDLGAEAARMALDNAGWQAEYLDFIIFATLSPDIMFPGSGCLMAGKLGLNKTPVLDIRQQCTGFLYGLATADSYIKSGLANRVLLVGGEVHSSGLDKTTRGRDVTVIFGDGAAAVCLEGVDTDDNVGLLASALHADGNHADSLMTELPASRLMQRIPPGLPFDDPRYYPVMDGPAIFKKAVRMLPKVTHEALEKANISLDEIDLVVPHQANKRINEAYGQFMKLDPSKIFHNIEKYGNTTAASIPLALHEAMAQERVGKSGDTVLFLGLGAGLTWGASIYRFF